MTGPTHSRTTTLRVLVAAAPAPGRAESWALFDAAGQCVRSGKDAADAWPAADRIEAVLAASQVRIATVALPPIAAARVASAVGFAVDDQLAGPKGAQHLAVSPQQPDGRVRVVIAARPLVAALHERSAAAGPLARVARVIAEPDLALPHAGWRWCFATAARGDGFARRSDGSAFPVSAADAEGALPPELALALAQARRAGTLPSEIRVDGDVADADLARWQRETGSPFVRGAAWRWTAAPAAAFTSSVDLLQGEFALAPPATASAHRSLFAPALILAVVALAVHVVATLGEWTSLKIEAWRQAREWSALAPETASTPAAAQAALARRYAELRHAHGLAAPDDALPLLAQAAPALRALPVGSVKAARYADGHWTLDLAGADPAAMADLDARLKQAGVPALVGTSAAGTRLRLGAL